VERLDVKMVSELRGSVLSTASGGTQVPFASPWLGSVQLNWNLSNHVPLRRMLVKLNLDMSSQRKIDIF
jgi:hypothetical protein